MGSAGLSDKMAGGKYDEGPLMQRVHLTNISKQRAFNLRHTRNQ